MNQPYKLPQIKRYANNDWCVEFWYRYPETWPQYPAMKRFKIREGINYIRDPEEKEKEIKALWTNINLALTAYNYDPFSEIVQVEKAIAEEIVIQEKPAGPAELSITEAFDYFIGMKTKLGIGEATLAAYNYSIKWFKAWIELRNENPDEKVKLLKISQLTTEVIERYLEEQQDDTGWAPRTYNNHLTNLVTVFRYLTKKRKILIDPLPQGAIDKKTSKAEKNKYYPKALRRQIYPELEKIPYLNTFVKWIYYSCARVNELCNLKVEHVDMDLRKIRIPSTVGKTGGHIGDRTVPMCQELYDLVLEMDIHKYPQDHYVFSLKRHPDTKRITHDYFRDRYLKIKNTLDFDRNYTLYSFKHTRVVDLLADGWPAHKVMFQTGHTDWTSFMKYCRELGAVIDDQLKGNTIAFGN